MTIEILNFTEALRLTKIGKIIIQNKAFAKALIQLRLKNDSPTH